MQPHSTRTPYFPANLEDYAPWVATHGLVAPYGECQCGCGQAAPVNDRTTTRDGMAKGHPRRFALGHNGRKSFPVPPNPDGLCMCGCGQPTPIATQTRPQRGYVKGEPIRFLPGHCRTKQTLKEAFWAHVTPGGPDGCWEWQGYRHDWGYGKLAYRTQYYYAHRVSYELHYGPIPDGLHVCHTCDNPRCCNPAHLFVGTAKDNLSDMMMKGRGKGQFTKGQNSKTNSGASA